MRAYDDLAAFRAGVALILTAAGQVYRSRGNALETEDHWRRAAEYDPRNAACREQLAALYQESGRLPETLTALEQLAEIEPHNPVYRVGAGVFSARLGQVDAAEKSFRKAVEQAPDRHEGYAALVQLSLQTNRNLSDVRQFALTAARLAPTAANDALLAAACRRVGDIPAPARPWIGRSRRIPRIRSTGEFASRSRKSRHDLAGPRPGWGTACCPRLGPRHARVVHRAFAVFTAWCCLLAAARAQIVLRDVTDRTGITFRHFDGSSGKRYIVESVASGLATFDYDGDGLIDIYFFRAAGRWDRPAAIRAERAPSGRAAGNALYRNLGGFRFADVTPKAGVGDAGYGLGVCIGDYDNDGRPDIYVSNYGPNVLYRNNGDGTFTDMTRTAGVARGDTVGAGANFLDIDGDGELDLFVSNYVKFTYENHVVPTGRGIPRYSGPRSYPYQPNNLYRNKGDGTFTDVTQASGIGVRPGPGMGIVPPTTTTTAPPTSSCATTRTTGNFLFHNEGGGKFREVGLAAGVGFTLYGEAVAPWGPIAAITTTTAGRFLHDRLPGRLARTIPQPGWRPFRGRHHADGGGLRIAAVRQVGLRPGGLRQRRLPRHLPRLRPHRRQRRPHRSQHELRGLSGPLAEHRPGKVRQRLPVERGGNARQGRGPRGRLRRLGQRRPDRRGDPQFASAPVVLRNESQTGNHWIQVELRGVKTNRDGVGAA